MHPIMQTKLETNKTIAEFINSVISQDMTSVFVLNTEITKFKTEHHLIIVKMFQTNIIGSIII